MPPTPMKWRGLRRSSVRTNEECLQALPKLGRRWPFVLYELRRFPSWHPLAWLKAPEKVGTGFLYD